MIGRLVRAVIVGAATVFAAKLPGQHWSTAPTATIVVEDGSVTSGAGDDPDGPTTGG